jgi:HK97 family phage prohead protease
MMQTTEFSADFIVEMREDSANPDIAGQGYGRAVPYGVETNIGNVRESFGANAFQPEDVIGKPIAYRHNEPIGVITAAENKPDGLYIDFNIANTVQGRDAATLIRTGSSKGLSVGFVPTKSVWNRAKTSVQHMAASLMETSITHMPAYPTAGVTAIREEEMSVETVEVETAPAASADIEAREAIASLREHVSSIEARSYTAAPEVHELAQFRSFGEYRLAVLNGEIEARALFDQVTGDNPGVMPPNWSSIVRGIFDLGRPTIAAFGVESAGTTGTTFNWPYWTGSPNLTQIVEQQVDEKDEVNSVQISLAKGTATLKTYAAGSDISYQLLQRSTPSYVDAHTRIMLNSYVQVTDIAFVQAVYAARTAIDYDITADTDGSAFRAAVFAASVNCQTATGMPAEFVIVSPAVFKKIGGWSTFFPSNYGTYNVSGTASANTLGVSVSGLPVILDRNFGNNLCIVSNRESAKWIEDGPRLASVENVAQLGRDVAVYGYGASQIISGAGIVSLENI